MSTWTTIGVNENIIEASLQALVDSLEYGLLRKEFAASHRVAAGACSDRAPGDAGFTVPIIIEPDASGRSRLNGGIT